MTGALLTQTTPMLAGVFAGGFLQGFVGFGFAIVAVPVIDLFLPPAVVLPYVMALQAALGLVSLPGAVKVCRWRLIGWLSVGMAAGTPMGFLVITGLPPAQGRLMLGLAVAAAFVLILMGRRLAVRIDGRTATAAGAAAGVMNGLAGMAGPPVVALVMSAGLPPSEARATLTVFVFGAALAALAPLGLQGRLSADLAFPLLLALPLLAAGWGLGAILFRRTSALAHRWTALVVIGFLAALTLLKAASELAHA